MSTATARKRLPSDISAWITRPRAFTLIEILIVIAIISLIAAILLPVFSRVRENARRSTCQSNLKQLGLAYLQYNEDYDDLPPLGNCGLDGSDCHSGTPAAWKLGNGWSGNLYPYVKNPQVYRCPSEVNRRVFSYRLNWSLLKDQNNVTESIKYFVRTSMLNSPSQTVGIYECAQNSLYTMSEAETISGVGNGYSAQPVPPDGLTGNCYANICAGPVIGGWHGDLQPENSPNYDYAVNRHLGGSNYLCLDGHVKWYLPENVSFGYRNNTATGGEAASGGTGSLFAQGTQFSGAGKRAITFSWR